MYQRLSTFVLALKDKKNDHLIALTKSVSLIKELFDKSFYLLLNKKTATKIQTPYKDKFKYISLISVTYLFTKAFNRKFSNCKNIIKYTSRYQIAFDKILNILNNDLQISKMMIEMTLQGSFLRHFGKNYLALMSVIETT